MQEIQKQYSVYQALKQQLEGKIKPVPIYMPFGRWFDKRFNLTNKKVLDIGSLINSRIYIKHLADNKKITKKRLSCFRHR